MYQNRKRLSQCRVILSVVKDLYTQSLCIQILRDAQNDTLVVRFYFDTSSFFLYHHPSTTAYTDKPRPIASWPAQ